MQYIVACNNVPVVSFDNPEDAELHRKDLVKKAAQTETYHLWFVPEWGDSPDESFTHKILDFVKIGAGAKDARNLPVKFKSVYLVSTFLDEKSGKLIAKIRDRPWRGPRDRRFPQYCIDASYIEKY